MTISYATPTGLYLIAEQIYPKPGFPSLGNTIGPSLTQIYRVVLQIYTLRDTYIDGKRVTDGHMSLWQFVKGSLGIGVTTRDTGASVVKLDYAGFTNVVQPLPELGGLIPDVLTRERTLPTFSPYIMGIDPFPNVAPYRNPRAVFVQRDGGQSAPIAVAKYNRANRELVMLDTVTRIDQTVRELHAQVPVLRF